MKSNLPFSIIGLGALGIYAFTQVYEKRREDQAREKLDFVNLTPAQIWEAGLSFGRERRAELYAQLQEKQLTIDRANAAIDVTDGIRALAPKLGDDGIDAEIQEWVKKALLLFDLQKVDLVPFARILEGHLFAKAFKEEQAAREGRRKVDGEIRQWEKSIHDSGVREKNLRTQLKATTATLEATEQLLDAAEKELDAARLELDEAKKKNVSPQSWATLWAMHARLDEIAGVTKAQPKDHAKKVRHAAKKTRPKAPATRPAAKKARPKDRGKRSRR